MIAPALIVVGSMIIRTIRELAWGDIIEALPGFLAMAVMAFTYSLSAGLAAGFVSYAVGRLASGWVRECPVIMCLFAMLFVVQPVAAIPEATDAKGTMRSLRA